jgi:phosphate transport system substrate-binding protein
MNTLLRTLVIGLLLTACQGTPPDPRRDDDLTSGHVLILAEEEFRSVLEGQRIVFEQTYADARVDIRYLPQADLLKALMNDSVRVVFTTCAPGGEQKDYFRSRQLSTPMVPVLVDAVAVLTGPRQQPLTLTMEDLTQRLSIPDAVTLFESTGSGVARTVVDSLLAGDATAVRGASAAEGLDSLISRLERDSTAIGLIPFALISDLDDPVCKAVRARTQLCAIAPAPGAAPVLPNQSTLADGSYPLRRKLYALNVEGRSGLGTGFVSFVAGHKGQRIILKSGLAPQTVPAREVMLVNP